MIMLYLNSDLDGDLSNILETGIDTRILIQRFLRYGLCYFLNKISYLSNVKLYWLHKIFIIFSTDNNMKTDPRCKEEETVVDVADLQWIINSISSSSLIDLPWREQLQVPLQGRRMHCCPDQVCTIFHWWSHCRRENRTRRGLIP